MPIPVTTEIPISGTLKLSVNLNPSVQISDEVAEFTLSQQNSSTTATPVAQPAKTSKPWLVWLAIVLLIAAIVAVFALSSYWKNNAAPSAKQKTEQSAPQQNDSDEKKALQDIG